MTALILLAAGRGSRFGGGKLSAELNGKPLARHAADRLAAIPFVRRIAICSAATPELGEFERMTLQPEGAPLSRSIALGVAALLDASAVMIALADMPLVPSTHFVALLESFDGDRIGSRVDGVAMAPAIFGVGHFNALIGLEGDRGAGALLRDARCVDLDPALAIDVDTPDDLRLAQSALIS